MAKVIHGGFRRLTDPNYVPDLSRPVMKVEDSPMLTLDELITGGVLPAGSLLSPMNDDDTLAEVTEDGYINVEQHLCESPDRAAREAGADVDLGWDY